MNQVCWEMARRVPQNRATRVILGAINIRDSNVMCKRTEAHGGRIREGRIYRSHEGIYDGGLKKRLETKDMELSTDDVPDWNRLSLNEDDPEFNEEFHFVIKDDNVPEADDENDYNIDKIKEGGVTTCSTGSETPEMFDSYINMEVALPQGGEGEFLHARAKRRALDTDGKQLGAKSNNPITDTRLYEVEFMDGTTEVLAANIIAENILSQVDEEGHRQLMIDEIIDHRCTPDAIPQEDAFYLTRNGLKRRKATTRGWEICIQWKDGSSNWVALKDVKDSNPIELAEYAIANKIQGESAFA